MSVHNVATNENGDLDVIDGSAYVPDENFPWKVKVEFPGSKSTFSIYESYEWIHNYSVVYSCADVLFGVI